MTFLFFKWFVIMLVRLPLYLWVQLPWATNWTVVNKGRTPTFGSDYIYLSEWLTSSGIIWEPKWLPLYLAVVGTDRAFSARLRIFNLRFRFGWRLIDCSSGSIGHWDLTDDLRSKIGPFNSPILQPFFSFLGKK